MPGMILVVTLVWSVLRLCLLSHYSLCVSIHYLLSSGGFSLNHSIVQSLYWAPASEQHNVQYILTTLRPAVVSIVMGRSKPLAFNSVYWCNKYRINLSKCQNSNLSIHLHLHCICFRYISNKTFKSDKWIMSVKLQNYRNANSYHTKHKK